MTQVNYNDGLWHGWNGGECPVHRDTIVEIVTSAPIGGLNEGMACRFVWDHADYLGNPLVAFRVIKEHREPREWWIGCNGFAYSVREAAEDSLKGTFVDPIHVREVLE